MMIWLFLSHLDDSRSSTPKSDSEISSQNKDNPEMLWTWGELPQAAQVDTHTRTPARAHTRTLKDSVSFFVFPPHSFPSSLLTRSKTLPQRWPFPFLAARTSEPSIMQDPLLPPSVFTSQGRPPLMVRNPKIYNAVFLKDAEFRTFLSGRCGERGSVQCGHGRCNFLLRLSWPPL